MNLQQSHDLVKYNCCWTYLNLMDAATNTEDIYIGVDLRYAVRDKPDNYNFLAVIWKLSHAETGPLNFISEVLKNVIGIHW